MFCKQHRILSRFGETMKIHCNEGPLSGEVGTDSFEGIPSEEKMAQWEDKAKLALIDADLEPANTDDVGNERYDAL